MSSRSLNLGRYVLTLGLFTAFHPLAQARALLEPWNLENDPIQFRADYIHQFDQLPLKGELKNVPWSDTYWPSHKGGIARRWTDESADSWKYKTRGWFRVTVDSYQGQSADLSPAEKLDLLRGDWSYSTVKSERERVSPKNPTWWGICNGWTAAALNHPEPESITVYTDAGADVRFHSADIKALLAYYYSEVGHTKGHFLGSRCEATSAEDVTSATAKPECRDVNAGAFHIVVANQIALLNEGFAADVTPSAEVWNHPIWGYSSEVLGEQKPSAGASPDAVRELKIRTEIRYTNESNPSATPHGDAGNRSRSLSKTFTYRIELDAKGKIVGGTWESSNHPDFLWRDERGTFEESGWEEFGELLRKMKLL